METCFAAQDVAQGSGVVKNLRALPLNGTRHDSASINFKPSDELDIFNLYGRKIEWWKLNTTEDTSRPRVKRMALSEKAVNWLTAGVGSFKHQNLKTLGEPVGLKCAGERQGLS